MATKNFLAYDLGAESGRAVIGRFDGAKLDLEEVHRFPNGGVEILGTLYWDIPRLFQAMKDGLAKAVAEVGPEMDGIGCDTWGVDFGLIGRDGALLGNPVHYRDKRTDGYPEAAFDIVPREEIFERTGIQFMKFNTVYQLLSMVRDRSPLLDAAETLLMMPDLLGYFLCGRKAAEFTEATTTQFYDPRARDWAKGMLKKFGIPARILPSIIQPGTVLDHVLPAIRRETGCGAIPVIAPATHDTGSAVAAVPGKGDRWAYISSGTWSLVGAEIPDPRIDEKALRYNFTNEGGVGGTIRFLKNNMGLWLVQECRRRWEKDGRSVSYEELTGLAAEASGFVSFVDPDDPSFLAPDDMPEAIRAYCERTGQPVPEKRGDIARCAFESLALKYRVIVDSMCDVLGWRPTVMHVVGGGSRNRVLCQFTADSLRLPVVGGPAEATAIGNVLMQAVGCGLVGSLDEARAIVRSSFQTITYEPENQDAWQEAYERFLEVTGRA
ncbi:MAG: rhamnulokinase [Planctomycetes bacterium]|nr:rhamnulokinase [Planctomycetota bacterium]